MIFLICSEKKYFVFISFNLFVSDVLFVLSSLLVNKKISLLKSNNLTLMKLYTFVYILHPFWEAKTKVFHVKIIFSFTL